MYYETVKEGRFIQRPNRFIAKVEIEGKEEICHVRNTGRCRELLLPGALVFLEANSNPARKTKFSIIGVQKGDRLINMDSQAPNQAVYEWLQGGGLISDIEEIKPEYFYGDSRFDFFVRTEQRKILIEVKGVTLEEDGVALFPDAPTERGLKHILGLSKAQQEGYDTYLIFVVQMKNVRYFTPNRRMQPAFGEGLHKAKQQGVTLLAYDCDVTKNSMTISSQVTVVL